MLSWANSFVQAHPALVKGVMAFTGVMGGAAVAVTGLGEPGIIAHLLQLVDVGVRHIGGGQDG